MGVGLKRYIRLNGLQEFSQLCGSLYLFSVGLSISAAPWGSKNWIVLHQVRDRSTYQSCRGIYSYFFLICYKNRGPRLALHLERVGGSKLMWLYSTVYSIYTDVKNIHTLLYVLKTLCPRNISTFFPLIW